MFISEFFLTTVLVYYWSVADPDIGCGGYKKNLLSKNQNVELSTSYYFTSKGFHPLYYMQILISFRVGLNSLNIKHCNRGHISIKMQPLPHFFFKHEPLVLFFFATI